MISCILCNKQIKLETLKQEIAAFLNSCQAKLLKHRHMSIGRIFFRGWPLLDFPKYFLGKGPKRWNFTFPTRNEESNLLLLKFSKGGLGPFRRPCIDKQLLDHKEYYQLCTSECWYPHQNGTDFAERACRIKSAVTSFRLSAFAGSRLLNYESRFAFNIS